MGRRALRKIPPNTDFSRHLIELDSINPPFDAEPVFDGIAPLEIEVGSGKGLFLGSASAANPTRHYLGIEIAGKYARFIAATLARRRILNARVIHGDALLFFRDHLTDDSVSAVHVYFPDPWWKKRHHKRRIMNEPFLLQVVRVLRPGARLHFWTDVHEYFHLTQALIASKIPLQGPLPVAESAACHDLDYLTHFERRTRLEGRPVYRAEYIKAETPDRPQERTTAPSS